MDELTDLMGNAASVGNCLASSSAPPDRASLYKRQAGMDQRRRRNKILELQKRQRKEIVDQLRQISDDDWQLFKNDYESMDTEEDKTRQSNRSNKPYKDQLMLSEWMVDVPEELEATWLMVLCPEGKRCLVVAAQGTTTAYTKSGYRLLNFPSMLPGGCKKKRRNNSHKTVLDCIFSETNRTFYILDVMCWNGHYVIDTEAEFRFFWRHSLISETEGLSVHGRVNPYVFHSLPTYSCSKESIGKALQNTYPAKIDGVLFYHKHTHYLCGNTPLVVWLKPYMVPEALGIQIHEEYMAEKPAAYSNMDAHLNLVKSDKKVSQTHQELYATPDGGGQSRAEKIILQQSRLNGALQSRPIPPPPPLIPISQTSTTPTIHKFGELPALIQMVPSSGMSPDSTMACDSNTFSQDTDKPANPTGTAVEDTTGNTTDPTAGHSINFVASSDTCTDTGGVASTGAQAYLPHQTGLAVTGNAETPTSVTSPLAAANTWNFALSLAGQTASKPSTNATSSANQWNTFR